MARKKVFETRHYVVIKKGNNYFGIEDTTGEEITSSRTMSNATKKVKLMEKVYQTGYEDGYAAGGW